MCHTYYVWHVLPWCIYCTIFSTIMLEPLTVPPCHGSLSVLSVLTLSVSMFFRLELHAICGEVCPGSYLAGFHLAITWLATSTWKSRHTVLCDSFFQPVHMPVPFVLGQFFQISCRLPWSSDLFLALANTWTFFPSASQTTSPRSSNLALRTRTEDWPLKRTL